VVCEICERTDEQTDIFIKYLTSLSVGLTVKCFKRRERFVRQTAKEGATQQSRPRVLCAVDRLSVCPSDHDGRENSINHRSFRTVSVRACAGRSEATRPTVRSPSLPGLFNRDLLRLDSSVDKISSFTSPRGAVCSARRALRRRCLNLPGCCRTV